VVAEAFMYRHHPQTALVGRLVEEGRLGEVRVIRGSFRFQLTRDDDVRWVPDLGGGCVWDVGCYPVSFARGVLREEPVEVSGCQRLHPSGVDETFVGQMVFPGGVLATFDASFRTPFATFMDVSGTAGSLRIANPFKPGLDASVELTAADGRVTTLAAGSQDLYTGEVEDLAAAVLDGTASRVSLADSRGNVAALAALLESARTGRPVSPALVV
jgi:predicted dehydrogenase